MEYVVKSRRSVKTLQESEDTMYYGFKEHHEGIHFLGRIPEEVEIEEEEDLLGEAEDLIQEYQESVCGSRNTKDAEEDGNMSFGTSGYISSVDSQGYSWGKDSKYWVMWTLWEPTVLNTLYPITRLKGDESCYMKCERFNEIINKGFSSICSDSSFLSLKSQLEMRTIVIRMDYEKDKEPFQILTETVEIKASEMIFNNGTVSYRFQPIILMACAGLAEILRAVCKNSDVLIISGTYKRTFSSCGKCLLLLNLENCNGHLQVLRLPFLDADDIYMVEKIRPTSLESRFQFKYFILGRNTRTRKEVTTHQNFKWVNNTPELDRRFFSVPIQYDHDPGYAYEHILSSSFHLLSTIIEKSSPAATQRYPRTKMRRSRASSISNDESKNSPVFFSKQKSPVIRTPSFGRIKNIKSTEGNCLQAEGLFGKNRIPINVEDSTFKRIYGIIPSSKFFEIMGKCAVMGLLSMLFIALLLIIFNPSCCEKDQNGVDSTDTENVTNHNLLDNRMNSVFMQCRNMIVSLTIWIQDHCGWNCIMKRLGFTIVNEGPVV